MMEDGCNYYNFYGCYLLMSVNRRYTGWTYIGFTTDPNRRIKQHNAGKRLGGARRTNGKGPWVMILVVHGFPNETVALQFEWAWQNPKTGRRLRHVTGKRRRESGVEFRFRILIEMLRSKPWCILPLTIRWLDHKYEIRFPLDRQPPQHMPIAYGPVNIGNVRNYESDDRYQLAKTCCLCKENVESLDDLLICRQQECKMACHLICLAEHFASTNWLFIPISGKCPVCETELLWGDLIYHLKLVTNWRSRRKEKYSSTDDDDNAILNKYDTIALTQQAQK